MDNEALKKSLLAVGLSSSVLTTTLPKEGHPELRGRVTKSISMRKDGEAILGSVLYPAEAGAAVKARTVFHTLAKEYFLSRNLVYVVGLARMIDAITTDDFSHTMEAITAAEMLFIVDFFEYGAPPPFTGAEGARFRAYIKSRVEAGMVISILADKALLACKDWYPPSFLEFLAANTETFSINKKNLGGI